MNTKWMIVSMISLLFAGCAGMEKPVIHTVDKDTFFVEAEEFDLTGAKVLELEGASGEKSVVLQDEKAKAEVTIRLSKGGYEIIVYGLGPSYDEDAFFMKSAATRNSGCGWKARVTLFQPWNMLLIHTRPTAHAISLSPTPSRTSSLTACSSSGSNSTKNGGQKTEARTEEGRSA